jgi:carboxypeptidase C (cathepsin A)
MEFKVEKLPGLDAEIDSYAGHIHVVDDIYYFFWLFKASKSSKLTLWFNGGPGCSSMDGVFLGLDF